MNTCFVSRGALLIALATLAAAWACTRTDENVGDSSESTTATSSVGGSVLYTFDGDAAGDYFGTSVSGAGDVNGDGFADLIVGGPSPLFYSDRMGSARVFSGADGSVLYTFSSGVEGDYFGNSVSGAGDVDGDGFADMIVGVPFDKGDDWSGAALVFSGADGSILYTFNGEPDDSSFGYSVSGAGDVNGDGFADLIVGASRGGFETGKAVVYSGADGSILYTFYGRTIGDLFGDDVSGAGDVDGDGFADVIVGAPADRSGNGGGSAQVFSGADGSVLYAFDSDSVEIAFGSDVSGAGDVNGDGFADLIVGAWHEDSDSGSGTAWVFSGADGSVLYTLEGASADDSFSSSVSGAGDVNGDGFADLIVGAVGGDENGTNSGTATVFSGADGSVLYSFHGDSEGNFLGYPVSGAGDVNGDGFDDLIVGMSGVGDSDEADAIGSARVFSGGSR